MRKNRYTEEQLYFAICRLASGTKKIKERLAEAYEYRIAYVKPESMPTEKMKKRMIKIHNRLTKNRTMPVHEAIHKWPLKSCSSIIQDICEIYDDFINFEWHLNP